MDKDPELSAVKGGVMLALSQDLENHVVTREEYQEEGHRVAAERFYGRAR
eukprot:CAMPEP_0184737854 /NCGR_PEP_ID=MMETSP0315-20130426/621_1 /TAXON_ID=101924 /ORGANISM="Rhodosorus marinus, Strain UTEX LB 2760" /LENGTH=49 /DNA_ID=CAMNT_0027205287 /DNA_START=5 /DNA_END=154 /DNA_ORIENTATION=+